MISYELESDFPGWHLAPDYLRSLIDRFRSQRILEIGSGANPTLTPEDVQTRDLSYTTSDVSEKELEKAGPAFERLVLDLCQKQIDPALYGSFDLVFSRMVNEHVEDGRAYHSNIYRILRPNGVAVHCFSTLWALPFVTNRFMPEFLGNMLYRYFAPRDEEMHGKFRAYYSWGRGPSKTMIQRFQSLGYEVLAYTGYFGHGYYRFKAPFFHRLEGAKARFLFRHPVPQLCSYATVVLRKSPGAPQQ